MSIEILFEDSSIIIIKKPAGLASQSADVTQPDCVSLIKEHIRKSNPDIKSEPYLGVIHRLDQPVEGILVFAKDKKAAAILSKQVQSDIMNKHYMALVEGILDAPADTKLVSYLYKDSKAGKAVVTSKSDKPSPNVKVQEAALIYRTEKIMEEENRTLLSIKLLTGRFHQIRAQLSSIGHPIVGDRKYGAVTTYPSGIALIADRLEFVHPVSGEKVEKVVDFSFGL